MAANGIGARLALSLLLLALASAAPAQAAPAPAPTGRAVPRAEISPAPLAAAPAGAPADPTHLAGELGQMRASLAELGARVDQLASGESPPPWASELQHRLGQRVERVMEMQERLAARIETPLPRLDEPIILLTVAASTLALGFILGRGLQRRRERRDGRFRL